MDVSVISTFAAFVVLVAVVVMAAQTSFKSHNLRSQDDNPHLGPSGREWRCLNLLTTTLFFGRAMHSVDKARSCFEKPTLALMGSLSVYVPLVSHNPCLSHFLFMHPP